MKSFITPPYTFDASAGTVDLSVIPDFNIKRLVAIINQTDGVLIYSTASDALKYTSEVSGLVTLGYDTTGMDDSDSLQVIYETPSEMVPEYQEIIDLTTVEQIFTAPLGAKWCKVMCDDSNSANVRVKIGATATTNSGLQFQPGRSEDFSVAGDISVIAESGTGNKVYVQFGA